MQPELSNHAKPQWLRIFVLFAILSTVVDAIRTKNLYNLGYKGSRSSLAMGLFSKVCI